MCRLYHVVRHVIISSRPSSVRFSRRKRARYLRPLSLGITHLHDDHGIHKWKQARDHPATVRANHLRAHLRHIGRMWMPWTWFNDEPQTSN